MSGPVTRMVMEWGSKLADIGHDGDFLVTLPPWLFALLEQEAKNANSKGSVAVDQVEHGRMVMVVTPIGWARVVKEGK